MTLKIITIKYIRYLRFKKIVRKYLNEIALHNQKFKSSETTTSTSTTLKDTPNPPYTMVDSYNSYVKECKILKDQHNYQLSNLYSQYNQQLSMLKKNNMLNAVLDDCFKTIKISNEYGLDQIQYSFDSDSVKCVVSPVLKDCGFLVSDGGDNTLIIDW